MAKILERDGLPTQQRRVLDFIEEYLEISGYPPSISEITDYLGVSSTFGVRKHLDALLRKGFLERGGAGLSRALMVTRPTVMKGGERHSTSIPVIGRVTAGEP